LPFGIKKCLKLQIGNEKESLKRELKEELDISVSIDDYITESFYEYGSVNINLKAYLVESFLGDFKLVDHDKIEWIKIEEIKKYDFAPADIPINDYLIKNGI
jgi:8-oxo-dGTP diphosphatase